MPFVLELLHFYARHFSNGLDTECHPPSVFHQVPIGTIMTKNWFYFAAPVADPDNQYMMYEQERMKLTLFKLRQLREAMRAKPKYSAAWYHCRKLLVEAVEDMCDVHDEMDEAYGDAVYAERKRRQDLRAKLRQDEEGKWAPTEDLELEADAIETEAEAKRDQEHEDEYLEPGHEQEVQEELAEMEARAHFHRLQEQEYEELRAEREAQLAAAEAPMIRPRAKKRSAKPKRVMGSLEGDRNRVCVRA
jgi:hypothetical protein